MENSYLNDLLRRIKNQDLNALEELYTAMKSCVYGLAFTYTKSHSDSEDIVQDTFLNIWNKCALYKEDNPKAWIMTITKNLAKNCIKKNNMSSELNDDIYATDDFSKVFDTDMLNTLLSNLKDTECQIVVMYSYGFTHAEIAEILSIPHSTVRWKYANAIKKLIKITGGEEND